METPELFDRIATHYDFWSNLISAAGIRAWHRFALDAMRIKLGDSILDVGSGTGTNTLLMADRAGKEGRVVGLDPSSAMIEEARTRETHGIPISWVLGQAEHLPFSDAEFDVVSAQFSLRNMEDWSLAMKEMVRVLKPNGRLVVLDVVQPLTTLGALAWNGLKMVTSRLHRPELSPYQWLGVSIDHAPTAEEVRISFREQGLCPVDTHHWLGDLVVVMAGQKCDPDDGIGLSPTTASTLLWAVDGSITARAAADWINVFLAIQSAVDIVTVIPPTATNDDVRAQDAHVWRGHAMEAARRLTPNAYQVRLYVLAGQPGPIIVRTAETVRATLIVVGEKGGSNRRNNWVGSVAQHVVQHAPCPVLVVPTSVVGEGVGGGGASHTKEGPMDP